MTIGIVEIASILFLLVAISINSAVARIDPDPKSAGIKRNVAFFKESLNETSML